VDMRTFSLFSSLLGLVLKLKHTGSFRGSSYSDLAIVMICCFQVEKRPDIDRFKSRVVYEDTGSSYGSYVGEAAIASSQTQVRSDQPW